MRFLILLVIATGITACANGIGLPGSPAWKMSAPEDVQREYYRGQCVQLGIKLGTPEMDACIASEPSPQSNRLRTSCTMIGNTMICN